MVNHIFEYVNYRVHQVKWALKLVSASHIDACRAWRLLVRFFFAQREHVPVSAKRLNLSPIQCHVLQLMEPDEPVAMGQLADTLSCDASNVTGLIDRLEGQGLVRRRPGHTDRRVKQIELTVAGTRIRAELQQRIAGESCALGRLSAAERKALVRLLEKLVAPRS
jgi:MarR family transcriptional regulator, organic hydroperoxide resistance regulator